MLHLRDTQQTLASIFSFWVYRLESVGVTFLDYAHAYMPGPSDVIGLVGDHFRVLLTTQYPHRTRTAPAPRPCHARRAHTTLISGRWKRVDPPTNGTKTKQKI